MKKEISIEQQIVKIKEKMRKKKIEVINLRKELFGLNLELSRLNKLKGEK